MNANQPPPEVANAATTEIAPGAVGGSPAAASSPRIKPRARRRRWRLVLGCLLVLLAIPVVIYFSLTWTRQRELEGVIAQIEADDPRWRMQEIMIDRGPIPDVDNPALVVGKVHLLLRPTGFDIGPKNWKLFEERTSVHRLNAPQMDALRPALEKHAEALKLARTLKDYRGQGHMAIPYTGFLTTSLDALQHCRSIMAMLDFDAMLRAEDEDADGALDSCRAVLVTARSIGTEPYLIAVLVRNAGVAISVACLERVLAQGEPSAAELAKIHDLLASEIDAPTLIEGMRGERAGIHELLTEVDSGKVKMSAVVGGMRMGGLGNTWEEWLLDSVPGVWTDGRAECLQLLTEAVAAAKLPCEQQKPAFAELDNKIRTSKSHTVRLFIPSIAKVNESHRRIQTNLRCALVGIAAERYRIQHARWPATIADLVADGLLKAVPIDPYDAQPLRCKRLPDGFVVYSVGPDGVDNGGNINRERAMDVGTDQGFRLWEVPARRQAPLPSPADDAEGPP
jgi:hypothetical protein